MSYIVSMADLSGTEHPVAVRTVLEFALDRRDALRSPTDRGRRHTRVTDAEDPERGDADWCEVCGERGAFRDHEEGIVICDVCKEEE